MEFFNHVQKVYTENEKNLNLDIPLAIFMIKLLSIKVDFSNFRDENKFNEYMNSHKPLKLRYYLQVTFREEIIKATEGVIKKREKENEYIDECFKIPTTNSVISSTGINYLKTPSYEKRIELYEKYLKDKTFDDFIDDKIYIWNQPVMMLNDLNLQIKNLIDMIINKKYPCNPEHTKKGITNIMNKFSDKESVDKLLHSIRDVYILGLV